MGNKKRLIAGGIAFLLFVSQTANAMVINEPEKYIRSYFSDPMWSTSFDSVSGTTNVNQMLATSAIALPSELLKGFGKYKKECLDLVNSGEGYNLFCPNADTKQFAKMLLAIQKNDPSFVTLFKNEYPLAFSNSFGYKTMEGDELFQPLNNQMVTVKTKDWFMWIGRVYGWDVPSYQAYRIAYSNGYVVYQQAELAPMSVIYPNGWDEKDMKGLASFDANIRLAAKKGWKFKTPAFQKRFDRIIEEFRMEEKNGIAARTKSSN